MAKTKKPAPKKDGSKQRFKTPVGRSSDRSHKGEATRKANAARKRTRPKAAVEHELPLEGGFKDSLLVKHAKTYAQEMAQSEDALVEANKAKQQIRNRMGALDATIFTAHGYEFSRTVSEESFSARKIKRGTKPADTEPAPPPHEDPPTFAGVE